MFGKRNVNLQLTPRAQEFVERFKLNSGLNSPILGIAWSRVSDEPNPRWTLGLYERQDVRDGWLGTAPEFDFVVIQEWALERLNNALLDFDEEAGIVVVTPLEPT